MLSFRTAKAFVYLNNITHNYRAIAKIAGKDFLNAHLPNIKTPWPALMPVVKADAYGLGHVEVAKSLHAAGARLFASGGIEEAVELSTALHKADLQAEVLALLGFTNPEGALMAKNSRVIPVVHCFEQLTMLQNIGENMPIALKFNTGMARLGFNLTDMPKLLNILQDNKFSVVLALSHFASADVKTAKDFTTLQINDFATISQMLLRLFPHIVISLCNSAGMMLFSSVQAKLGENLCRPGLALFGVHPFGDNSAEGFGAPYILKEALEVSCPVLAKRTLLAGQSIGYSQTHVAQKDTEVAIIGIGYADGFSRNLSSRGKVNYKGRCLPILGRVSMQMTAVDITEAGDLQIGDMVHILGGAQNPITCNELAELWNTTPHEVLCMLGNSLHKEYR